VFDAYDVDMRVMPAKLSGQISIAAVADENADRLESCHPFKKRA
jgi:hypothetical protein